MKIRNGFVTNSSSTSYIYAIKKPKIIDPVTELIYKVLNYTEKLSESNYSECIPEGGYHDISGNYVTYSELESQGYGFISFSIPCSSEEDTIRELRDKLEDIAIMVYYSG